VLDEIVYFGLQPDLRSYVGCIYACAQRPDFHTKAFELYDTAMAQGYIPDVYLLNTLMVVCQKLGDFETADMLWRQYKQYDLKPDSISYMTYIHSVATHMRRDLYVLEDKSKLTRADRLEICETKFDEMLESGLRPSRRALNNMLMVYTKGLMYLKAEEFKKIVFARFGHDFDYYTHFHFLNMYYWMKDLDAAMLVLGEMKANAIEPDYDAYMLVLRLCKYRKNDAMGVRVLKEMCDRGITADEDVAYPFQEIVESLPDYKAPPSLWPERKWLHPVAEGFESTRMKARREAKEQKTMMLNSEPPTPLERWRSHVSNYYNEEKFAPNNPKFERNYMNRDKFKDRRIPERDKYERKKYRLPLLTETAEDQVPLITDAILDKRGKELEARYRASGKHLPIQHVTELPRRKITVK
jgi:pentatricopeptide repeat protein